ncbi:MAG TPA: hybrid sensor histidine kinase/response regulator [Gemmatimonadaceae bacterium]|nr:hybrid sensor histidine kinase/response regulator [Gemmatimonadaceae bacterium]
MTPSDSLAARLRLTFLTELDEQLEVMNRELLALEHDSREGAAGDAERLGGVFRVAHTLKGAARVAGIPLVESVCHALESILADVRGGRRSLGAVEFSLLFTAVDALADAGRRLRAGEDLTDSPLEARDRQLATGFGAPLAPAPPTDVAGAAGAAGVAGVAEGRRGERGGAATPALPATPPGTPARRTEETGVAAAEAPETPATPDTIVRVEAAKLDDLLNVAGELAVAVARAGTRPEALQQVVEEVEAWVTRWQRAAPRLRQSLGGVDTPAGRQTRELLDELDGAMRRIGVELGRAVNLVRSDAQALARASDDLDEGVYRLRTRPFSEAAEALPRAVRDVAAASGKEVELRVTGGEIEADRAVLDTVRDALLHLVRNAVDHGIEPPDVRERAGKPRRGVVQVGASVEGGLLRVTVSDDGRGLDVAAVREGLVQRGLPVPADDREVARTLFEGGFSTRREATAFSGRGVGLDVVRAAAERVRGSVDVQWTAGRGTTFVLETPLTLATLQALVVRVGEVRLAIPTLAVARLLRVRPDELRVAGGRQLLPLPEGPVPVVSLATLLGPPLAASATGDARRPIVLLEGGERRLGVIVDELLEQTELVIRPVERRGAGPLPHVAGAALLADGVVAIVLNAAALLSLGLGRRGEAGAAAPAIAPTERGPACILVVDDSITTRTLEQSVLEAAGYEVVTAVDGQDGWRLLQERGADLVITDVEMPRMDGFALCETIRASRRFAQLPVVLVTSLESPEHRARGLEAGADAYVVKSDFDQEALLATVHDLLARESA